MKHDLLAGHAVQINPEAENVKRTQEDTLAGS